MQQKQSNGLWKYYKMLTTATDMCLSSAAAAIASVLQWKMSKHPLLFTSSVIIAFVCNAILITVPPPSNVKLLGFISGNN